MKKHSERLKKLGFHTLEITEKVLGKDREKEHETNVAGKKSRGWSKVSHFVLDYPLTNKKLILHPTKGYKLQSV